MLKNKILPVNNKSSNEFSALCLLSLIIQFPQPCIPFSEAIKHKTYTYTPSDKFEYNINPII